MPVRKCANGKYQIGSGDCRYDTKDAAERAYSAALASGKIKEAGARNSKKDLERIKNIVLAAFDQLSPEDKKEIFDAIASKLGVKVNASK